MQVRSDFDGHDGLSPRVRGNLSLRQPPSLIVRSIPARAGEPAWGRRSRSRPKVYPRACGGTLSSEVRKRVEPGLSPRVRGNPRRPARRIRRQRSIPARAGEPMGTPVLIAGPWVYPRACGGTP